MYHMVNEVHTYESLIQIYYKDILNGRKACLEAVADTGFLKLKSSDLTYKPGIKYNFS